MLRIESCEANHQSCNFLFVLFLRRRHEALSSFGQSLAPVDVWTAGNRQRRLQQKVTMDLQDNAIEESLATVEDDGPEFNE